jgi:hypothetical protein
MSHPAHQGIARAGRRGLIIGVIGFVVCGIIGAMSGFDRAAWSGLISFNYWLGLALGSMALMMLHQLSGGRWGVVVRRPLEAAANTLPLLAGFFLLLMVFGMDTLYEWAIPSHVEGDHILEHKASYLNVPFFALRAVFYFAVWYGMTTIFRRLSLKQDETGDPRIGDKLRTLSAPGIVAYVLTISFASVDWVMSLDAHWFSTIFGVLTLGGQGLSALAFGVAIVVLLARSEPMASVVKPLNYHDLGKLMLAFVMLWAYFNLSQFLIIWAGNLPEEIPWYLRRMAGHWKWLGLGLVFGHFAFPFLLLLSADLKKRGSTLSKVALLVLVMRAVDIIWLIAPEFHGESDAGWISGFAMDIAAIVGLGGLWVAWFCRSLGSRALIPPHDPNLAALEATKKGRH